MVDLAAMLNGGRALAWSNKHYGHPRNLIAPGRAPNMGHGWETARRLDRPPILQYKENGCLDFQGRLHSACYINVSIIIIIIIIEIIIIE
jgi:allantoicase